MDGVVLGFFLLAAFLGAVTTGVAGFAMGLVVSGIWLHILTPVQTVSLMVSYSVLLQGYGVWKLRHALDWRRVAPFIVGGAIGVPIGAMLLRTSTRPTCAPGWAWYCCSTASTTLRGRRSSRCRAEFPPT